MKKKNLLPLAVMLVLFSSNPVFAEKYHKTVSMIDDVKSLEQAMLFTIPESIEKNDKTTMFGRQEIIDEVNKELDDALIKELGEENFQALTAEDLNQKRESKAKEFMKEYKYNLPSSENSPYYDGELWKRQGDRTHKVVMEGAKLGNIKAGDKISYHLNEKETPWLGNMLSDNLGGITNRWMNGRIVDKLTDYPTYFEDAWGLEKNAQKYKLKQESSLENKLVNQVCENYNKVREDYDKTKEKMTEVDKKIDEEKNNTKREILENHFQTLAAHKKKVEELYPALIDVLATHTKLSSSFSKTECYMILNYNKVKPLIEERVKGRLKWMTQAQVDALSPTEKYDIANGFYDFRTTAFEKIYKGKKRYGATKDIPFLSSLIVTRYWEGRCNADRACGVCHRYEEPASDVTTIIDEIGKTLTFHPLDSKALLMSTYFYLEKDKYAQMGQRTESLWTEAPNPNPAALDILLRTVFMNFKVPFVFDNHNDHRVNNVTLVGFDRKIESIKPLSESEKKALKKKVEKTLNRTDLPLFKAEPPKEESWNDEYNLYSKALHATKKVRVSVDLRFIHDLPFQLMKVNGPTKPKIAAKKLSDEERIEYDLYLNDKNEIVEGDLIKGDIDFLWFAAGKGAQELNGRKGANTIIKYDIVDKLAKKAANGKAVKVDREEIFPASR